MARDSRKGGGQKKLLISRDLVCGDFSFFCFFFLAFLLFLPLYFVFFWMDEYIQLLPLFM